MSESCSHTSLVRHNIVGDSANCRFYLASVVSVVMHFLFALECFYLNHSYSNWLVENILMLGIKSKYCKYIIFEIKKVFLNETIIEFVN